MLSGHSAFVRRDGSCFLPIQTKEHCHEIFLLKMKRAPGEKPLMKGEKSYKNIFLLGMQRRSMYSLAVKIGG
jgi:hypothetical protein